MAVSSGSAGSPIDTRDRDILLRPLRYSDFPLLLPHKENAADAQIVSTSYAARRLVRQTAAGIYAWIPLGKRV